MTETEPITRCPECLRFVCRCPDPLRQLPVEDESVDGGAMDVCGPDIRRFRG